MDRIEAEVQPADQRCACVLVLDTSGSMEGEPIEHLNQGIAALETMLKANPLAARRVEIAVVTFGDGGARLLQDFISARQFTAPVLAAGGQTPMGEAVRLAVQALRRRKNEYRARGTPYFRPWLVLLTDGEPTDPAWELAAQEVRREESQKALTSFTIGVGAAVNVDQLRKFSMKPPALLIGYDFEKMFDWLSHSLQSVSSSSPGDQIELLPVDSWARIL